MKPIRRFFTSRQKNQIYIAANGKCQNCNVPLERGWHADHHIPFCKGGQTVIANGRALCRTCSLKKGSQMPEDLKFISTGGKYNMNDSNSHGQSSPSGEPLKPRTGRRKLRRWQEEAKRIYAAHRQKEFLLTATPGSGKSAAAAEIARMLMERGKIDRIVVVAPTEHLKYQWAKSFHEVGIKLDPTWSNANRDEPSDAHGIVVTYAQVSADSKIYDFHCRRGRTLVTLDEIHHSGDNQDWAIKLRRAFKNAALILGLSGTLFRHDNKSIPFVKYGKNGKSIPDFTYSYGDALKDDVCRPVVFPTFEGSASWYDGRGSWKSQSEFNGLSRKEAAELLRVILDPAGNWLRTVLREANDKLTEFRLAGHPDAAGLVIARSQKHARKIAALLEKITGENVTIVISEDPESDKFLHDFKAAGNTRRWIVAVKMVSEGIDIQRLRVGVYATTTLTEMAFRQAVGRFVRMIAALGEQHAAFYMPAHPDLVKYALAIKEERDHVLASAVIPNTSPLNIGKSGAYRQAADDYSRRGGDFNNESRFNSDVGEFAASGENELPTFDETSDGSPHNMGLSSAYDNPNGSSISSQICIHIESEARYEQTIYDGKRFSENELKLVEQHAKVCGLSVPLE